MDMTICLTISTLLLLGSYQNSFAVLVRVKIKCTVTNTHMVIEMIHTLYFSPLNVFQIFHTERCDKTHRYNKTLLELPEWVRMCVCVCVCVLFIVVFIIIIIDYVVLAIFLI